MTEHTIYKICTRAEWDEAERSGEFVGSAVDLVDGFIHFSAAHQVAKTAALYFAGQSDLMLVSVSAVPLGDELKWETSRGGDRFPHLYGDLLMEAVTNVDPLPLDANGKHVFPPGIVS